MEEDGRSRQKQRGSSGVKRRFQNRDHGLDTFLCIPTAQHGQNLPHPERARETFAELTCELSSVYLRPWGQNAPEGQTAQGEAQHSR